MGCVYTARECSSVTREVYVTNMNRLLPWKTCSLRLQSFKDVRCKRGTESQQDPSDLGKSNATSWKYWSCACKIPTQPSSKSNRRNGQSNALPKQGVEENMYLSIFSQKKRSIIVKK